MIPISAGDRLPTKEECDAHGYCWWWIPYGNSWALMDCSWSDSYEYWLPYQAIPDLDVSLN